VYLLAERNIFEFSKVKMTASLCHEYPQASGAIVSLSKLRVLNSNFFSGGTLQLPSDYFSPDGSLSDLASALSKLVNTNLEVSTRSYGEAVVEFARASLGFRILNYRLRMWFLLLIYDGLNLYRCKIGIPGLTSFSVNSLEEMAGATWPISVSDAATESLNHIRNYPLKYFLSEDAKINGERATHILQALAEET
jgi:hypothetical protein